MSMVDLTTDYIQLTEQLDTLDVKYKQIVKVDLPAAKSAEHSAGFELRRHQGAMDSARTMDQIHQCQTCIDEATRKFNLASKLRQNLENHAEELKASQPALLRQLDDAKRAMWQGKVAELMDGLKFSPEMISLIERIMAAKSFAHSSISMAMIDHVKPKLGELSRDRLAEARAGLLDELGVSDKLNFTVL